MKKPDEIKKGLECCSVEAMHCGPEDPKCAYDCGSEECIRNLMHDALALIQQLEAENAELKREKDAAVSDLKSIQGWQLCNRCKNYDRKGFNATVCIECINGSRWEWRGPCEENGGVA